MSTATGHKAKLMDEQSHLRETNRTHHQAVDASLAVLRVDRVFHPCDLWGTGGRRQQDSGRICQYSTCELWVMTLAGLKPLAQGEF